ncbi:hypothetical protein [Streptomyces sp. NPDC015414]|uniref:hypothetical protein n=1 Tax=Streptomyces sp. NPDC015414 TaxID=3364957 RepID=UPI0037003C66
MEMKKVCATLFAAVVMAAIGFQGTAAAAHPSGCHYGKSDLNGAEARCSKANGGHYKAIAVCWDLHGGPDISREAGAWVKSGYSLVFCPPMTKIKTAGIMTKAD